jgi:hypothetical protein
MQYVNMSSCPHQRGVGRPARASVSAFCAGPSGSIRRGDSRIPEFGNGPRKKTKEMSIQWLGEIPETT